MRNAVVFETDKSWTDMIKMVKMLIQDSICQYVVKNPFQNDEIQIFNIVKSCKI